MFFVFSKYIYFEITYHNSTDEIMTLTITLHCMVQKNKNFISEGTQTAVYHNFEVYTLTNTLA